MGSKRWLSALKIILTLASLYLIARRVDFPSLWPILERCRIGYLAACITALVASSFLTAYRWRLLWNLRDLPLRKYLYFVYLGYFFSAFLPSAASSEAIRVVAFGRKYGAVQQNIGVNLLARGMGFVVQVAIGVPSLWAYRSELLASGLFARMALNRTALWTAGLAAAAAILVLIAFRAQLARQRWLVEIRRVLKDPKLWAGAMGISVLIQVVTIFAMWLLFKSLIPEVRLWQVVLFPGIIQMILLLPISFGGMGVREYLNILFYSDIAGLPRDTVFAVSLLGYVPTLSLALWGWGWMMFRRVRSRD
jgi:glycosyltransferase 2 family protein